MIAVLVLTFLIIMNSHIFNLECPELEAQTYLNVADTLKNLEFYQLAISFYLIARDLAILANDSNIKSRICSQLISAYVKIKNVRKSIELANDHIQLTFIEKDIPGRLRSYQALIQLYNLEGEYDKSLACAFSLFRLAKAIDHKEIENKAKRHINTLRSLLNKTLLSDRELHSLSYDHDNAVEKINGYKEYMMAKHLCNQKPIELHWPWFLGGGWNNSKKHKLEELREMWSQNKDRALELYLSGDHYEALKCWKQNSDIVKSNFKNSLEEAITCENLGKILYGKRRFNEALPYFERMLEISVDLDRSDLEKDAVSQLQTVYRRKCDELKKAIFKTAISLNVKKCLKRELNNFHILARKFADISRTLDTIRRSWENYLEELLLLAHTKLGETYYSLNKYVNSKYHYRKALLFSRTLKRDDIGLIVSDGLQNIYRVQDHQSHVDIEHRHSKSGTNASTKISDAKKSSVKEKEYIQEPANRKLFSDTKNEVISNFRELQQQLEEHGDLFTSKRYISSKLRCYYMKDVDQLLIEDEDIF